jgi:photosystem II stability/assembly factor-like uncharacterized protein
MKKLLIVFLLIITHYSLLIAQPGWYIQQSTFPGIPQDLFFIDSNTGWIMLDSGRIIRTTNGGTNWSQPYYHQSPYHITKIKFVNSLTGWAVGGESYYNPWCFEYSIIMKSTNGGINWITQFSDSWGPHFNDLAVVDTNFAFTTTAGTDQYCMASTGGLVKTSNGGINWLSDPILGLTLTSVYFTNSETGWVSAYAVSDVPPIKNYIYKTTNKGVNWIRVFKDSIFAFTPSIQRIYFPDLNTGYKIYGWKMKKTTNSGLNWTSLDSLNTYNPADMFFVSSDTGWIIKNNIKRTNNGGISWTIQNAPASASKIFFVNANTGWALGSVLMKTITGGITFINQITNHIPEKFSLYQNYPNPFNPVTKIRFEIPLSKGGMGVVLLKIYDITGREIQTLVNEKLNPGSYEVTFDGSNFASGVYFYQLKTSDYINTKKLILLK